MKKLANLLFGITTLVLFTSYNTNYTRIPLVKKLREIEQDKYKEDTCDCKCKSFRYYINLREKDENVHLTEGWVNNSNVLHAYLRWNGGRILDPTFKTNKDGVFSEKGIEYKDIYSFEKDITIEDLVKNKNCKVNKKMLKRFKEAHPNFIRRTLSSKEVVKNIANYCKKDSAVFSNYTKRINKLKNKK